MNEVVVCGAGGFIGGHLVADLLRDGQTQVRAVDVKPVDEWFQVFGEADNRVADLSDREACRQALDGARHVFNLAADMGGMGFIEANKALACCPSSSTRTCLWRLAKHDVERFFFASSACVYAADKQTRRTSRRSRKWMLSGDARGWLRLGEALQ